MNKIFFILILATVFLSSCEVVEGIFKAGFFSAIILGILVIILIVWIANRFRKN